MRLFNFSAENCTNCYKCVRACPVNAIRFKNNHAEIDEDKCIACGKCFVICPKHARNVENDVDLVMHKLGSQKHLTALIDSSYLGLFDNPGQFIAALKKLGFASVQEVAVASKAIADKYTQYIKEHSDSKYLISTCCPTSYLYIKKYYPELVKYLIPIVTPMVALAKAIKAENSETYTVYIGPCLSKKYETLPKEDVSIINAYITFEEIIRMFRRKFIKPDTLEPVAPDRTAAVHGKSYSISGDALPVVQEEVAENGYDYMYINGLDNVKNLFESLEKNALDRAFISISACPNSCINGPFTPMHSENIFARKQKIKHFATRGWGVNNVPVDWEKVDFTKIHEPMPVTRIQATTEQIEEILHKMDKHSRTDELDCGACGYNSCREKAQAVFEGMTEIDMCMPYMRARAENMTDVIFLNSRNAIFILDSELKVRQFNPVAERTFQVTKEYMIGKPISLLMDDKDFFEFLFSKTDVINRKVSLSKYGLTVMENLMYLAKENAIIVTMQDVTEDEKRREELDQLKIKTVDIAQNVIEKQMRVAQEIASLLGETTAETKVALNKLKDIVVLEEGE